MPAVTSAFADLTSTKFQIFLVNVGRDYPRLWPRWIDSMEMDTNPFISEKISGMPLQAVKPEGQQFTSALPITGPNFQVTAVPYGMLFSVTWEMWRDDKYGVMETMYTSMGRGVRTRQEIQAFAAFNNAFSVATGYDSTDLCSTSHVDLDGTVQANRPSPDVTLSQTALQAMQINFDQLNDEVSLPQQVQATRVMAAPTNRYLLRELLGSSGKPQTADNDLNAIMMDDLTWGVVRFLTRTQDWFGLAPIKDVDIQFMWRDHPRARTFDDPFIEAADHTTYQRFAVRLGDWRGVYGSSVGV
jgi:hypothetical protein